MKMHRSEARNGKVFSLIFPHFRMSERKFLYELNIGLAACEIRSADSLMLNKCVVMDATQCTQCAFTSTFNGFAQFVTECSNYYLDIKKHELIFIMIEKMNLIKFNVSKNEIFQLTENYKTVHRKLKSTYKIEV